MFPAAGKAKVLAAGALLVIDDCHGLRLVPYAMTTSNLPVLYSFRRCPYAIRARLALAYTGVQVEVIEVALRQKPAALLAASPKGTVPVLVTLDGSVIEQSIDIMHWALHQNDPEGWLIDENRDETNRWIALNDNTFKPLLDGYKYAVRHPEVTPEAHRNRAMNALIWPLEAQLQQTRWLAGPQFSIADVALFPFVRQFAGVDKIWFDAQPIPSLQEWLNTWLSSSLFNGVMQPQTKPG